MSGSSILVDTNIILYLVNGDETVAHILDGRNIYISFITELELLGFEGISSTDRDLLSDLVTSSTVIDINSSIKKQVIEFRKKYKIKLPDAIIAATSIYLDIPLFSADKGFEKVEELNFLRYEVD